MHFKHVLHHTALESLSSLLLLFFLLIFYFDLSTHNQIYLYTGDTLKVLSLIKKNMLKIHGRYCLQLLLLIFLM